MLLWETPHSIRSAAAPKTSARSVACQQPSGLVRKELNQSRLFSSSDWGTGTLCLVALLV